MEPPPQNSFSEMTCEGCIKQHPFLLHYEGLCVSKITCDLDKSVDVVNGVERNSAGDGAAATDAAKTAEASGRVQDTETSAEVRAIRPLVIKNVISPVSSGPEGKRRLGADGNRAGAAAGGGRVDRHAQHHQRDLDDGRHGGRQSRQHHDRQPERLGQFGPQHLPEAQGAVRRRLDDVLGRLQLAGAAVHLHRLHEGVRGRGRHVPGRPAGHGADLRGEGQGEGAGVCEERRGERDEVLELARQVWF